MTTTTTTEPVRKLRCRILDERLNRCPNERMDDDGTGLCAHHLAEAAEDFRRLTTTTRRAA